jgi:hypothetical protein
MNVQHGMANWSRLGFCLSLIVFLFSGSTVEAAGPARAGTLTVAAAKPLSIVPTDSTATASVPHHHLAKSKPVAKATKSEPAEERYFVEFRSRTAQSYGHTFIVHGRVTGSNVILPSMVAGLFPKGGSAEYMLGHVVPVPGEVGVSNGDTDERYLTAKYRIEMGKADYERVVAYIRKLQASLHTWTATNQNCNWFAGQIAQYMGLRTPDPMEMPKEYINDLRAMNSRS